ncbi:MAG: SDR family oxidoreductase [Bacillota bacterium]|nr:SDR family oxidoreductase [Bacillota bacterium]
MYPIMPMVGQQTQTSEKIIAFPDQQQNQQPGIESTMNPRPIYENPEYKGSGKLLDKVAVVTGGDSGIGRAVAIAFASEGADLVIPYLSETQDAMETQSRILQLGRKCLLLPGDLREEAFCNTVIDQCVQSFGRLDILVNNHGVLLSKKSITEITAEQLEWTFCSNVYPAFYLSKAALAHLKTGSVIINTVSVTAFKGNEELLDYSASKGALVAFTRSLSLALNGAGIRVNAVSPGPVWTPLIPAGFPVENVKTFGTDTPIQRAAQPFEMAGAYVYLASDDSGYMSGQILHVNGGVILGA